MKKQTTENELRDYTRAELLWLIDAMKQEDNDLFQKALLKLNEVIETDRKNEAERYAILASEKRTEYLKMLAPYDGLPITSIPYKVLLQLDELAKDAQAAAKRHEELTKR